MGHMLDVPSYSIIGYIHPSKALLMAKAHIVLSNFYFLGLKYFLLSNMCC